MVSPLWLGGLRGLSRPLALSAPVVLPQAVCLPSPIEMINGKLIFHSLSSGCCFFIVWDKVWVTMLKQSRRLHGPQTKVSLQNPIVSGVILGGVFEPSFLVPIYIAGGFP